MNRAVQLQKFIPANRTVKALNPQTERWEEGLVYGTYQNDKIGDPDCGFKIRFCGDNDIQEINQKHIDL